MISRIDRGAVYIRDTCICRVRHLFPLAGIYCLLDYRYAAISHRDRASIGCIVFGADLIGNKYRIGAAFHPE